MTFVDSPIWQNTAPADPLSALLTRPALQDLLDHWRDMCGDRLMPSWCDIDPAALVPHLPYLWSWTYDRVRDSFTGRIAGEEINAMFGKSLRHMPMAVFFKDWDYPAIFQRHKRVVSDPSICVVTGPVYSRAAGRLYGQRLILPLAADGENADGIIGVTIPDQTVNESPDALSPNEFSQLISGKSRLAGIGEETHYFPLT